MKIENKVEYLELCKEYNDLIEIKEEMGKWFDKVVVLPILLRLYQKTIIQYEENNPYKFNMFVNRK